MTRLPTAILALLMFAGALRANSPTVRAPFHVAWVRHFAGERLGSAMEPIVGDGKVFVASHNGNVYALDAATGQPVWRFAAHGAFLQAPAFADGLVVAASTDRNLYALNAGDGKLRWSVATGPGGCAASPTIADGAVFIGSRLGEFLGVELKSGRVLWRQQFDAPIRQTAAVANGRVFVTAEDLRVRCLDAKSGKVVWTSEQRVGQTARDYSPVVAGRFVIVRTNPVIQFSNLIAQDRRLLCQNAGVDDSDWKKLDAWTKSDKAIGTPDNFEKEQAAIVRYLKEHRESRTFFVLDAATGQETLTAPVLWCGGCQGVGNMPAVMPDGRLLVMYRSAYGNWNHGVAPLVALGILDLANNRIEPLRHVMGTQPPWNTFWGTADESQNFVVSSNTVVIVHQSTLSGFDLTTRKLFPIAGERDGWGGFRNLPWVRNEWNGPARGRVAIVCNRIYWQTGSRVQCIVSGEEGKRAEDLEIERTQIPSVGALDMRGGGNRDHQSRLQATVNELLSKRWAPLYVEPGLAGREFSFDNSGDVFSALAWAFPHLEKKLQERVKTFLAEEWATHPPFARESQYALNDGDRREQFWIPPASLSRLGHDKPPHPFGNMHAIWLYAGRGGEGERVTGAWDKLNASFEDFAATKWHLDPSKGDLYANRYLASLIAFARIAETSGHADAANRARAMADETTAALVAWWKRSADRVGLVVSPNCADWDKFITEGDALFFKLIPHKSKIALFHDLTPEVAALVKAKAPEAVDKLWQTFEALCPTWHLVGEEHQVHFGENFVDTPDFAMDAFAALAWLRGASADELARRTDIPICRADLYTATKLAVVLENR